MKDPFLEFEELIHHYSLNILTHVLHYPLPVQTKYLICQCTQENTQLVFLLSVFITIPQKQK